MNRHANSVSKLDDAFLAFQESVKDYSIIATLSNKKGVVWSSSSYLNVDNSAQNCTYPIYSIGKSFIAAMILILIERKLISMDSKIGDVVKLDVDEWVNGLTIRALLTHRSGLGNYGHVAEYHERIKDSPGAPIPVDVLLGWAVKQGPLFAPFSSFSYSNPGYYLLCRVISACTEVPFVEAFEFLIRKPLGLLQTSVPMTVADVAKCDVLGKTKRFGNEGESLKDVRGLLHPGWVAHGLIISNGDDLNRFFHSLFSDLIENPELKTALEKPYPLDFDHPILPDSKAAYGMGLMGCAGGRFQKSFGHNGEGPGYSTATYYFDDGIIDPFSISTVVGGDLNDMGMKLAYALANAWV